MSIFQVRTVQSVAELASIGTASDLGATILDGVADIYGLPTFGGPGDPVHAGYFGVTKSSFRMVYPFHEHATVVLGEVRLTDEASGESRTYKAGDSWVVKKDTPVLWEVLSEQFVKHYLAAV